MGGGVNKLYLGNELEAQVGKERKGGKDTGGGEGEGG